MSVNIRVTSCKDGGIGITGLAGSQPSYASYNIFYEQIVPISLIYWFILTSYLILALQLP